MSKYAEHTRKNEANALAAEREGRGTVDAWPIMMVFEFTGACNLQCFMCGFKMTRDKLRAEDRTNFVLPIHIFRLIAEKAFPHISIINPSVSGEPFMLPYFDEMLEAAEKYDCRFDLCTNGMLLCGDRLDRLMPRLACLSVSFDGASKEVFEYVRTGATFETVRDNVLNFGRLRHELGLENQIDFNFNITLLAESVHELPRIIEFAKEAGVDTVSAGYMMIHSESTRKSSPLNCPEKTNRALAEARERAAALSIKITLPNPLPTNAAELIQIEEGGNSLDAPTKPVPVQIENGTSELNACDDPAPQAVPNVVETKVPETGPAVPSKEEEIRLHRGIPDGWKGVYYCNMPWSQVYIGQSGEIWPCCSPSRPLFGNGFEKGFMEIWNGPEYQRLREGLFSGDLPDYCKRCPFLQEAGDRPYESEGFVFVDKDNTESK